MGIGRECQNHTDARVDGMNSTTWTVWVNRIKVTANPVTLDKAREIAERYTGEGYTDTYIDNITWDDINEGETK